MCIRRCKRAKVVKALVVKRIKTSVQPKVCTHYTMCIATIRHSHTEWCVWPKRLFLSSAPNDFSDSIACGARRLRAGSGTVVFAGKSRQTGKLYKETRNECVQLVHRASCVVFLLREGVENARRETLSPLRWLTWRGVESKCLWFFNKLLSDVSDAWIYDPLKFDSVV